MSGNFETLPDIRPNRGKETPLRYLDPINCDYYLGRAADRRTGKNFPETLWAGAHARLIEYLRRDPREQPMGYSYIRGGDTLCMAGLARPDLAGDDVYDGHGLDNLVKDTPFTTLVSTDGEVPVSQVERNKYFAGRMQKVKKVIFVMGGLMESRLAMEGVAREILQAQEDKDEVAVIALSHSGAEKSYKEGAELAKVTPGVETQIIKTSIERILQLYKLTPEQVVGLVGHSKGGWFVEQLLDSKDAQGNFLFPMAAGVEIAMVTMGTKLSKNMNQWKRYKWFSDNFPHIKSRQQAVKIQNGDVLARIVDLAIKFPDMRIREMAIGIVGKWVAEHYVGKMAAYKVEAIAQIVQELMYNRKAIWAQQRSLAQMGIIVKELTPGKIAQNPRLILGARTDTTLEYPHQMTYKNAMYDWLEKVTGGSFAHERALTTKGGDNGNEQGVLDSGHNPNTEVVEVLAKWLNDVRMGRINRATTSGAVTDAAAGTREVLGG